MIEAIPSLALNVRGTRAEHLLPAPGDFNHRGGSVQFRGFSAIPDPNTHGVSQGVWRGGGGGHQR